MVPLSTPRRLLGVMLLLLAGTAGAQQPRSADGWILTGTGAPDFEVSRDERTKRSGGASARVRAIVAEPSGFASVTQFVRDPSTMQGKRVRFSVWIRSDGVRGVGPYLYVSAQAPGTTPSGAPNGAYANSRNRADASARGWRQDTVSILVPANATGVSLGVILEGAGEMWVDDGAVAVAEIGAPVVALVDSGFETLVRSNADGVRTEARVASPRELDAIVALSRLTGHVRFFHPADSVVRTDWQRFLVGAIRTIGAPAGPEKLAASLDGLFRSIAPSVEVFPTAAPPSPYVASQPPAGAPRGIALWIHRGIGHPHAGQQGVGIYSSERFIRPWTGELPKWIAHPDSAHTVDLGAGVSARIPTSLYVALPSDTAARRVRPVTPAQASFSLNDRAVRMAAAAELWMVMRHFYPYWDVVRTDWDAEFRRTLVVAATAERPIVFDSAMTRLTAALRDGHGYISRLGRALYHYGVTFALVEGKLVVTHVRDMTRTPLRPGDVVEEVDGIPALRAVAERAALVSSATRQWAEYRAVTELAASADSVRDLVVRSPVGPGSSRRVQLRGVLVATGQDMPSEPRPAKIAELRPGVLYVDLERISNADFTDALPRLQQATSIVFDMRGYPANFSTMMLLSRLTDSTVRSAHFAVPVRSTPDVIDLPYDAAWTLAPIAPRLTARVYFLTDGRAISYAESTMGVVEYYKLGEIVGEPTAGTNGNINPFRLPGGYTVTWTGMLVEKRDGTPHHGVGIKPTVPVSRTLRGVIEGRDEILERALELIAQRTPRG